MYPKKALVVWTVIILLGAGIFLVSTDYLGRWTRGYRKLPEITHTVEAYKKRLEQTEPYSYGIDEDEDGEIWANEVDYRFSLPVGWNVENNTGGVPVTSGKVIFRFYGEAEVWGSITKVDISNLSDKTAAGFAKYYTTRRSSAGNILGDIYSIETHKKEEKRSRIRVYSTIKSSNGKYASIEYFRTYEDAEVGFIVRTCVPPEELNKEAVQVAYRIDDDFLYQGHIGGE